MKSALTAQQLSFFTLNGYLEIGGLSFDPKEIFAAASAGLKENPLGRDLWRSQEVLKTLLFNQIAPAVIALTKKPRLAMDQLIIEPPKTAAPLKDLFCIQGIDLFALFIEEERTSKKKPKLGILPYPSHPTNVLFVRPHIILNWSPKELIYVGGYCFDDLGVYVHNPKDPAEHFLKDFGYSFGDRLKDPHHPLLR